MKALGNIIGLLTSDNEPIYIATWEHEQNRPLTETVSNFSTEEDLSKQLFFVIDKDTTYDQGLKKVGLVKLIDPQTFPYTRLNIIRLDKRHRHFGTIAQNLCHLSNKAWNHIYIDENLGLPGHNLPYLVTEYNFPTGYTKIKSLPDDISPMVKDAFVSLSVRETIQAASSNRLKTDSDLIRFADIITYGQIKIQSIEEYHNLPKWLLGGTTVNPDIEDGLKAKERIILSCAKIWSDVFREHGVPTNYAYDGKNGIFDLDIYKKKGEELGMRSYIEAVWEGVPLEDLFVSSR